jgi:PKD repeat protein
MKTIYSKKIGKMIQTLVIATMTMFAQRAQAQCQANFFSYAGPNGLMNFISTSTGTLATTHYYWSSGQSIIGQAVNVSHTFTNNGYHGVCLFISDSTNLPYCNSWYCDTVLVTSVITPSTSPCQANFNKVKGPNGSVSFTSTSTGVGAGTSYLWSFGSGLGNAYNTTTPSYTYGTNGAKWICLTITNTVTGCSNTKCDSVIITNASATNPCSPTVMFGMVKDSLQTLNWYAIPNYPNNVTGATWNWGDGSSTTNLYPSHTYSAAGLYSICVTASVSCGTVTATYCYVANIFKSSQDNSILTLNVRQSIPTGLQQQSNETKELKVFPNPSAGEFTLLLTGSNRESVDLVVYNLLGEKVFAKQYAKQDQLNLDLNQLSSGQYYVQASCQSGIYFKKIVIQK